MKKLLVLSLMITSLLGAVVLSYAYTITDETSLESFRAHLQQEKKEFVEKGGTPLTVKQFMSTAPPAIAAIMVALIQNDRKTILEMAVAIDTHAPINPKSREPFTQGKEILDLEWITYGLDVHYQNQKLIDAAKDPKVEMNVVRHHFNRMIDRCIRCHERFRDPRKAKK